MRQPMRCLVRLLVVHFRKGGNGLTEAGIFRAGVCIARVFRSGVMLVAFSNFLLLDKRPWPNFEATKASLVTAIQATTAHCLCIGLAAKTCRFVLEIRRHRILSLCPASLFRVLRHQTRYGVVMTGGCRKQGRCGRRHTFQPHR